MVRYSIHIWTEIFTCMFMFVGIIICLSHCEVKLPSSSSSDVHFWFLRTPGHPPLVRAAYHVFHCFLFNYCGFLALWAIVWLATVLYVHEIYFCWSLIVCMKAAQRYDDRRDYIFSLRWQKESLKVVFRFFSAAVYMDRLIPPRWIKNISNRRSSVFVFIAPNSIHNVERTSVAYHTKL